MSARLGHNRSPDDPEADLVALMAEVANDPLAFVRIAYPWGSGILAGFKGPDTWQAGFLREWGEEIRKRDFDGFVPVLPVQMSVVSGHGVGKSTLTGWAADFIRSTRPHSKGIATANTSPQLQTKTWGEIAKWHKLSITSHWFDITSGRGAMAIWHKQHRESWRLDGMAWRENQPEAFAGLHAATSTPYYIFDEASGVPRAIFETAQGGLTDGEPMIFLFGNGTKNSGFFYETHHRFRDRWLRRKVDSRTAARANKALLNQWIADHGIDSDFVKVRILGDFPSQSAQQLIPTDVVTEAMTRPYTSPNLEDPLIMTVDVARFGDDSTVIRFRKGRDSRSIPKIKRAKQDTTLTATHVAALAKQYLPDAIVIDGGGVGGGVVDLVRHLNVPNVYEFNFGGKSPDPRKHKNMAAYVWSRMGQWLKEGGLIEDDEDLKSELTAREYYYDLHTALYLETKDELKERGEPSPDDADALAMSFLYDWGPRDPAKTAAAFAGKGNFSSVVGADFDPFSAR